MFGGSSLRKKYYSENINLIKDELSYASENGAEFNELFLRNISHFDTHIMDLVSKKIQKLTIDECNLEKIPSRIFDFLELEDLSLCGNNIGEILPNIKNLSKLKILRLIENNIKEIVPEVFQIQSLKTLSLINNGIKDISVEIRQLRGLQELKLGGNELTKLPYTISELSDLKFFDCSRNKLKVLPEEFYDLIELEELDISFNRFSEISSLINGLKNLKVLDLSNNLIQEIPKEIGLLPNLEVLNLSNNRIRELPPEILNLKNLKTIITKGNPIINPPVEILNQGLKSIFNYLRELVSFVELHEAKLLIVGEGGVGKTSLAKKMMDSKAVIADEHNSTEGIDIRRWEVDHKNNNLNINIWDFGGQEIYHSTHQFFLTKRSVYVFLWEAKRDEHSLNFDYWLNVINLLAGDAPVLVVQNKIEDRIKPLEQRTIIQNFKNVKQFFDISTKENRNIEALKDEILKQFMNLEHIGTKLPKVWVDIRKELESLNENYISYTDYLCICKKYGLNEDRALFISRYYHDLGVFLNFDDNMTLKNILFLNPSWATNAVYMLLDDKAIIENNGQFSNKHLQSAWNGYVDSTYFSFIIELMKKFELCFPISEDEYIIPELMNADNQSLNDYKISEEYLQIQYRYGFMPSGVITRFIVKMHSKIDDGKFTKNKVIIRYKETRAFLSGDMYQRKIDIKVFGNEKHYLLNLIRDTFDDLHRSLSNPNVKEEIPCNCNKCTASKIGSHYFSYEFVENMVARNKKETDCPLSYETINLNSLLARYDRKESSISSVRLEDVDVFICHSSKDKEKAIFLSEKLKSNKISYWIDHEQIKHGDGVVQKINEGLLKTTVLFLIYSRDTMDSKWCREEYESCISASISGKNKKIIPILLDDISHLDLPPLIMDKRAVKYENENEIDEMISQLRK